jgi:hypothetical protein
MYLEISSINSGWLTRPRTEYWSTLRFQCSDKTTITRCIWAFDLTIHHFNTEFSFFNPSAGRGMKRATSSILQRMMYLLFIKAGTNHRLAVAVVRSLNWITGYVHQITWYMIALWLLFVEITLRTLKIK